MSLRMFPHVRAGRACLFLAISLLLSFPAFSQTLGQITGHVADASNASVAGATITLTNVATNGIRTTLSTDSGDYTFPSVPPGFYNVKTEHPGFKTATSNN